MNYTVCVCERARRRVCAHKKEGRRHVCSNDAVNGQLYTNISVSLKVQNRISSTFKPGVFTGFK